MSQAAPKLSTGVGRVALAIQELLNMLWVSIGKEFIPTSAPTIDAGKVKFRKGKIKSWRSLCNI